jgi:teichoic acid transport system ATP-binding protein
LEQGNVVFDGEPLEAVEIYTAASLRANAQRRIEEVVEIRSEEPQEQIEMSSGEGAANSVDKQEGVGLSSAPELLQVPRVSVLVNEKVRAAEPGIPVVVSFGDRVRVEFHAKVGTTINEPIWGYNMRDRMGTPVFGENTIGCGFDVDAMSPGEFAIYMEILWPEVQQGEYTMTIGVGDGRHSLHHEIVAWVQGILQFVVVPKRDVHGLFNNDLKQFGVSRS